MAHRKQAPYYTGSLLAGAVGDALGAPIEFMSLDQIRSAFGPNGLSDYTPAYGRKGSITDDTQMTLFTAEGLILSRVRAEYRSRKGVIDAGYHALLRWLYTQETGLQDHLVNQFGTCSIVDGVLTGYQELFSQRAPGNSCLSALRSGRMGRINDPVNNSKGCGAVMRMAPVGLIYTDAAEAFDTGCRLGAITRGHPTGYLTSGLFASMISLIIQGLSLTDAMDESLKFIKSKNGFEETLASLENALDLAVNPIKVDAAIQKIGEGWVAEEALGIAVFCAFRAENNLEKGLLMSVNHSGDSDSTGSITGNLLGALLGVDAIPDPWIKGLELKEVIEETARDLLAQAL